MVNNTQKIYIWRQKSFFLKKALMHLDQQLAALREHSCTKLLSDYMELNPEFFFVLLHGIC